jgi:hypothetical protein
VEIDAKKHQFMAKQHIFTIAQSELLVQFTSVELRSDQVAFHNRKVGIVGKKIES